MMASYRARQNKRTSKSMASSLPRKKRHLLGQQRYITALSFPANIFGCLIRIAIERFHFHPQGNHALSQILQCSLLRGRA